MNHRFVILAAPLLFAGCASQPDPAAHEPYVRAGLILLTADQARRFGVTLAPARSADPPLPKDLAALDARAVTAAADVKVYTLARAVDAGDPALMHEEHVVYRRETTPRWRLDAPADQKILVGPRVTDGRQDLQPLLTKELTTFLADERRATDANQKAIATLFQAVDALNRQQETLIRHELGRATKPENAAAGSPASVRTPDEGAPAGAEGPPNL